MLLVCCVKLQLSPVFVVFFFLICCEKESCTDTAKNKSVTLLGCCDYSDVCDTV